VVGAAFARSLAGRPPRGTVSSSGPAQRTWIATGLACDVADALAALAGGRRGYLSRVQTAMVTAPALAGIALGVIALTGQDDSAQRA
jgi:hypothetical protein